jgi:hypothetical protein
MNALEEARQHEGPTLRDRIVEAHEGVAKAEDERARLLRLARERGATVKALAELIGQTEHVVRVWSGGAVKARAENPLDGPA